VLRRGAGDRVRVAVQRVLEQRPEVEVIGREAFGGPLRRRSLDTRLTQVARDPLELRGDLIDLARESALA